MFKRLFSLFRRLGMGGANEITTPKKQSAANAGGIRIHDNNGEKHFHDDAAGIKAAVPVSLWFKVSSDLITLQRKHWEFLDPANATLLTIDMTEDNGTYDLVPTLKQVKVAKTLESLSAHLKG